MALQKCGLNLNPDRRELQPHGTIEFPCAGYSSRYTACVEDIISWHWHEEMEVIYVEEGGLKVKIPGKTFHAVKGESIFINSNILHYAEAQPACNIHSLVFHPALITGKDNSVFAKKYIMPLIHFSNLDGYQFISGHKWAQDITANIMTAFEAISSGRPGYEFIVREKLSLVCLSLYQSYESEMSDGHAGPNPDTIRIRQMLDFIQEHYSENLELAQIAKAGDVGERECLRCFQRVIQISPMQYLIKYRVTQGASMLLKSSNVSIADIAIQCGFDSPSNFSQVFKRFFMCTPKEYRKKGD